MRYIPESQFKQRHTNGRNGHWDGVIATAITGKKAVVFEKDKDFSNLNTMRGRAASAAKSRGMAVKTSVSADGRELMVKFSPKPKATRKKA